MFNQMRVCKGDNDQQNLLPIKNNNNKWPTHKCDESAAKK